MYSLDFFQRRSVFFLQACTPIWFVRKRRLCQPFLAISLVTVPDRNTEVMEDVSALGSFTNIGFVLHFMMDDCGTTKDKNRNTGGRIEE